MSGKILDGKLLSQTIKEKLKEEVIGLKKQTGKVPTLISILVGKDEASQAYTGSQKKTADYIGINYQLEILDKDITEEQLVFRIRELNKDPDTNGVIIQKPLPTHVNYQRVSSELVLEKDVEGITIANLGKLISGNPKIFPCTAAAAMEHIYLSGISIKGKEAVVVGRSEIVGKPVSLMLLAKDATVTVCHSATSQAGLLEDHIRKADILIAAVGKSNFIKGSWIKEGAVVVDVGINYLDGKMVGDVEFEEAKNRASYITPVPGGVGPVTVVILMRNAIEAFKSQINKVKV